MVRAVRFEEAGRDGDAKLGGERLHGEDGGVFGGRLGFGEQALVLDAAEIMTLEELGREDHGRTLARGLADEVYVDPAVVGYVAELAEESRRQPHVKLGLSPRGCLAFVRVAKTWAAADGRDHVVPDDIKDLAEPVLSHRLLLDAEAQFSGVDVQTVISRLLDAVAPPTDRVGA